MLYLPIKNVRPGMVVAKPVCHARNRVYFVQKGYALDHRTLARLTALGVHSLWIECAGMEEVGERINDVVIEKRQDLGHVLTSSIDDLRQRTDKATESAPFESKVGGLLAEILDDPFHEPLLATMSGDCGALVRHLSNCCYVCLLLGTHLSGYVRRQRRRIPARIAEDVQQLGSKHGALIQKSAVPPRSREGPAAGGGAGYSRPPPTSRRHRIPVTREDGRGTVAR